MRQDEEKEEVQSIRDSCLEVPEIPYSERSHKHVNQLNARMGQLYDNSIFMNTPKKVSESYKNI